MTAEILAEIDRALISLAETVEDSDGWTERGFADQLRSVARKAAVEAERIKLAKPV